MLDKKNFSSGLCLLGLGLFLVFQSLRLQVWSRSGPEAGFFPLVISGLIIGFSLIIIIQSLVRIGAQVGGKILEVKEKDVVSTFKVCSYAILLTFYGISIQNVGFLITSTLFLFLTLKYVERQSWKITILVGGASIILSYLLFVYFLGVPLPKGLIEYWR